MALRSLQYLNVTAPSGLPNVLPFQQTYMDLKINPNFRRAFVTFENITSFMIRKINRRKTTCFMHHFM